MRLKTITNAVRSDDPLFGARHRLGVLFCIKVLFFEVVACYQSLLLSASSDTSAPSGGLEEGSADSTWPALTLPHFRVGWRRVLPWGCCVAVSEPSHWDPLILQHSCHKNIYSDLNPFGFEFTDIQ